MADFSIDPEFQDQLDWIRQFVADNVERMSGLECRSMVLGHIQRGGTPTARDRVLATRFGHAAYELLMKGRFGEVVVEQKGAICSVPIPEVAGKTRTVPQDHDLIGAARSVGTAFGD